MPMGISCCAIEMMAVGSAAKYDIARFGGEVFRASPRQADLMIVAGRVSNKMAPVLRQIYDQMSAPKWVLAMGACASSGGVFDTYSVLQGIDKVIPVDVYVPGCPPRPEQIVDGVMQLQELVRNESVRRRNSPEYKELLASYNL
jgi:NADH-quinone oxidoreductase subunit B